MFQPLENDVWILVFSRVPTTTLVSACRVCRQWNQIIRERFPRAANLIALYRTANKLSDKDRDVSHRISDYKKSRLPFPARTITHCVGNNPIDPRTHFVQKNGSIVFPPVVITGKDLLPFRSFQHGKEIAPPSRKKNPSLPPSEHPSSNPNTEINTGWGNLTKDVLHDIFYYLIEKHHNEKDLVSISKANKHWKSVATETLWLMLYLNRYKAADSVIPLQIPINCKTTKHPNGDTSYDFQLCPEQVKISSKIMQSYYQDRRTVEMLHKTSKNAPDTHKLPLYVLPSTLVVHADVYKLKELLLDGSRLLTFKDDTKEYLMRRCDKMIQQNNKAALRKEE